MAKIILFLLLTIGLIDATDFSNFVPYDSVKNKAIDSTKIKDTTVVDSATADSTRKSLYSLLKEQSKYLYSHPTKASVIFNPQDINRIDFSRDDYFTWNDVLRNQGEYTQIFYSPRFHFNRPLWRGYTISLEKNRVGIVSSENSDANIFPYFQPLELEKLTVNSDGKMTQQLFPQTRVSTQVFFIMENGLFGGNSLELRIMRNFTRYLSIGLFSSFRNLDRVDYSHQAGGVSSFYNTIPGVDTSKISQNGRNPFTQNHISTIAVHWKKKSTIDLRYTYQDLSNDFIQPYDSLPEESTFDTVWYNRRDYNSSLNLYSTLPLTDRLSLFLDGQAGKNVYHFTPLSLNYISKSDETRGEQSFQGAGGKVSFSTSETNNISLLTTANHSITTHTNNVQTHIHQTNITVKDTYKKNIFSINGTGGASIIKNNGVTTAYPKVNLNTEVVLRKCTIEGWGKYDIVPLIVPYDSTLIPSSSNSADDFWGVGTRLTLSNNLFSVVGGYSYIGGITEETVNRYWQKQESPYSNPSSVFSITPAFGEWKGISLSSSWLFSDTKPYVKSSSRLNFHIHKGNRTRHVYVSFLFNYWSQREFLEYAGRDNWNKPIFDIGSKITAEMKSFRLFMKIDNLLNRNNSYVPGYYMPGLIIRWGFAWTITG